MLNIDFSPGVKEPLCGWQWVWQHQNDTVPYTFELVVPGATYKVTAKNERTLNEVIKANIRDRRYTKEGNRGGE